MIHVTVMTGTTKIPKFSFFLKRDVKIQKGEEMSIGLLAENHKDLTPAQVAFVNSNKLEAMSFVSEYKELPEGIKTSQSVILTKVGGWLDGKSSKELYMEMQNSHAL